MNLQERLEKYRKEGEARLARIAAAKERVAAKKAEDKDRQRAWIQRKKTVALAKVRNKRIVAKAVAKAVKEREKRLAKAAAKRKRELAKALADAQAKANAIWRAPKPPREKPIISAEEKQRRYLEWRKNVKAAGEERAARLQKKKEDERNAMSARLLATLPQAATHIAWRGAFEPLRPIGGDKITRR